MSRSRSDPPSSKSSVKRYHSGLRFGAATRPRAAAGQPPSRRTPSAAGVRRRSARSCRGGCPGAGRARGPPSAVDGLAPHRLAPPVRAAVSDRRPGRRDLARARAGGTRRRRSRRRRRSSGRGPPSRGPGGRTRPRAAPAPGQCAARPGRLLTPRWRAPAPLGSGRGRAPPPWPPQRPVRDLARSGAVDRHLPAPLPDRRGHRDDRRRQDRARRPPLRPHGTRDPGGAVGVGLGGDGAPGAPRPPADRASASASCRARTPPPASAPSTRSSTTTPSTACSTWSPTATPPGGVRPAPPAPRCVDARASSWPASSRTGPSPPTGSPRWPCAASTRPGWSWW